MITKDDITKEKITINVHHIGGIEGCGPVEMLDALGTNIKWIFYDADKESLDDVKSKNNHELIHKCIGGKDGPAKFRISVNPSASSVLPIAESAKEYVLSHLHNDKEVVSSWINHAKTEKIVDIEMNKLDTLLEKKEIPEIDFLSIDAQGLEYDIMNGVENNIDDILGIITELEFSPLYEGQGLFADIDILLREKGFRFAILFNSQYFNHMYYPKSNRGQGFLTVAEGLYLRNPETLFSRFNNKLTKEEENKLIIKCLKLAIIGLNYNQPSFSYDIINRLTQMKLINIEELYKSHNKTYLELLQWLMEGTLTIKFSEEGMRVNKK